MDMGDFSGLSGYTTVPDPRNTDYEITPTNLQRVYNTYLAQLPRRGFLHRQSPPDYPTPASRPENRPTGSRLPPANPLRGHWDRNTGTGAQA